MKKINQSFNYQKITDVQKDTWSKGDFNVIALTTMDAAEDIVRSVDPHGGDTVLDVACGSGNVALTAARRHCDVSGIDYVPELIERAKIRAEAEGTSVEFQVGDIQNLPYANAHFDFVFSVFGVMFSPDQKKTAQELLRVCRPGGTIAMANWMPEKFGGDFFKTLSQYTPPPPGLTPPVRWGTEKGIHELLGDSIASVANKPTVSYGYFRSIEQAVEVFSTYFGPIIRALELAEDEQTKQAIKEDIGTVFSQYNRAADGTAKIEYEYMQTIATRA